MTMQYPLGYCVSGHIFYCKYVCMYVCSFTTGPHPQHVSCALPPSIFSPNLVPTLFSHLVVFGMLAPLFGFPSLLILDLLTLTLPSNLSAKLILNFCSKHFWSLTFMSVRFWFDMFMLIFALKSDYIASSRSVNFLNSKAYQMPDGSRFVSVLVIIPRFFTWVKIRR